MAFLALRGTALTSGVSQASQDPKSLGQPLALYEAAVFPLHPLFHTLLSDAGAGALETPSFPSC